MTFTSHVHMIGRALGFFKLSTDSFQVYFKRCSGESRAHVGTTMSDWSASWISATVKWDDHTSRDWLWQSKFFQEHPQSRSVISKRFSGFQMLQIKSFYATSFSWAVALSRFRTGDFFSAVRVVQETPRSHSSRTNTRIITGYVHPRYHDNVVWARSQHRDH